MYNFLRNVSSQLDGYFAVFCILYIYVELLESQIFLQKAITYSMNYYNKVCK